MQTRPLQATYGHVHATFTSMINRPQGALLSKEYVTDNTLRSGIVVGHDLRHGASGVLAQLGTSA